jgi:hypothetical protein
MPPKKPRLAKKPRQSVITAVTVPVSKSSDTPQAKKLLAAVGERPKPKRKRRR